MFDGAEQDTIITEDNNRLVHTIYEISNESNMIQVTHNGSDVSNLQNEDTTQSSAVVEAFDANTNILTLNKCSGTFDDKVTLTGSSSGSTARVRVSDHAVTPLL